ncbi:substrate-binding periplasmic protein [Roseateles cavernae]|uniref:substrate-binding periplasmic protein n=1 Tax=Roseateles cavernae TaxID=3153578 RepID=UPI0032E4B22B
MVESLGRLLRRIVLWPLALGLSTPSLADCSRAMQVPAAPVGLSMIVSDEGIGGVYHDVLNGISGCNFLFTPVPRARLEAMFENGRADLLIPAARTPRRDEFGVFVPLIYARATLISLNAERAPVRSLQELRERKELRVALVRGFDYGDAYQALIKDLRAQGRLFLDVDPVSVGRMLQAGLADITIMAPSILVGALLADTRFKPLIERLRYEPVDELPWVDSGAYISRTSVSEQDRAVLREALEKASRSGIVWKTFQRYYPVGSLADSIKPR